MDTPFFEEDLYSQNTEFQILHSLFPYINGETFIDVGAEKGTFARFFLQRGFQGTLFEPCSKHHPLLQEMARNSHCQFFPYAIDARDRQANFYISCDEKGEPTDSFHSLHYLDDPRVKHQRSIQITCRNLQSLFQEGVIDKNIGVLKIDTEGNDLQVLKGMGEVNPEVLICEFFTTGLYAGWEQSNPRGVIAEAEKLGFTYYLAVKRFKDFELVSFSPAVFCEQQWGNLIFLKKEIYRQTFQELQKIVLRSEQSLFATAKSEDASLQDEVAMLRRVCNERLELINVLHEEAEKRLQIIHKLELPLTQRIWTGGLQRASSVSRKVFKFFQRRV